MSYQDQITEAGSAFELLRQPAPSFTTLMPYPSEYSNWRAEQKAWAETAVLFDQSYHMTDLYITGPDALKLLSDTAVNSFKGFGEGKAKQYVPVNAEGFVIGDAILLGLPDDEYVVIGNHPSLNWIQYQAKVGDYDVTFVQEDGGYDGPVPKRMYRFEVQGPLAGKVIEKAAGGPIDPIKFFQTGTFTIAGIEVTALSHTMVGVPGNENTGLEIFGPVADGPRVLEALLEAGEEFGMIRAGATSYLSALCESGWIPIPLPAIYGDDLKAYREQLPEDTEERWIPLAGSYQGSRIEDYYATPWDLGYERIVKFDHDFIGREALEKSLEGPRRRKVWLEWNREDTEKLFASIYTDGDDRPRPIEIAASMSTYDQVLSGDRQIGYAQIHGYTVNLGEWISLATVNDEDAIDGADVEVLWGEPDGAVSNPFIANHKQVKIRAKISTVSPIAKR